MRWLDPHCLQQLESHLMYMATLRGDHFSLSSRCVNEISVTPVDDVAQQIHLSARTMFPADEQATVRAVSWGDNRLLYHGQGWGEGQLFVLLRKTQKPMFFVIIDNAMVRLKGASFKK